MIYKGAPRFTELNESFKSVDNSWFEFWSKLLVLLEYSEDIWSWLVVALPWIAFMYEWLDVVDVWPILDIVLNLEIFDSEA